MRERIKERKQKWRVRGAEAKMERGRGPNRSGKERNGLKEEINKVRRK